MDQCLGIWQWSFHAPYPSRRLGTGKRSALRRAAPRPARARNQAGHSKSLQQKTTVQLQQAYLQAALAHRERVQQIEGLQAHRNPATTGWREITWPLSASPLLLYGGFNDARP